MWYYNHVERETTSAPTVRGNPQGEEKNLKKVEKTS